MLSDDEVWTYQGITMKMIMTMIMITMIGIMMFRRVLSDIAVWIYQGITKMMEDEIHPILVQALLEHEGIGGLSGINLSVDLSLCLCCSVSLWDGTLISLFCESCFFLLL